MKAIIENNIKIITPNEGYFLTNYDGKNLIEAYFSEKIYANINFDESTYKEITEKEKELLEAEQAEQIKLLEIE